MGRYDALTHLEEAKEKQNASEIPSTKKPAPPVTPVAKEKYTSLLANQQTSKEANQQASKPVNQQNSKLVNQQASKVVNQQSSKLALSTKEKRKYGTYLRPDSILKIQIQVAQEQKKDHELLQEIVDLYYSTHEN
jgi:hypothetical protein